jgi:hypothetical protein
MMNIPHFPLRTLLGLTGLAVIALGINVGFGGMKTLGWQGPTDFLTITNPTAFLAQDNHVRFLGGVWIGCGLLLCAGTFALERIRSILIAITGMVFVGGLLRLTSIDVILNGQVAPSLFAELVLFPTLAVWIARTRAA